jgi:NAD-dependent dihydropyrimidine dehydrogenase PreA subunit
MAIDRLDLAACNGCEICFAICPQDVFRLDAQTGLPVIRYPEDCIACWSCELFCPVKCIKVSEPRAHKLPEPDTVRQSRGSA